MLFNYLSNRFDKLLTVSELYLIYLKKGAADIFTDLDISMK